MLNYLRTDLSLSIRRACCVSLVVHIICSFLVDFMLFESKSKGANGKLFRIAVVYWYIYTQKTERTRLQ